MCHYLPPNRTPERGRQTGTMTTSTPSEAQQQQQQEEEEREGGEASLWGVMSYHSQEGQDAEGEEAKVRHGLV